ncbi:thioredoxin family protein [Paenibacillus sp. 1001270B_150601_E10]|uniref:thioredoxin family protein n=1 Tax=Paenibacillus sp. 1001270B_150601_E10 TaxID=2787079 RepID=UPI0018A0A442|nr:thioredoxin family protein [Paenibacillus sp. 1001270B_150601_E10]
MEKVQTSERFNEIIAGQGNTVAIFKTSWCSDCHYIEPFMPELEERYSNIQFIEVDAEALVDIAQDYHIMGIPSFVAFKGGKETIRFVNKLRKTKPEIEQFLDRSLEVSQALGH